MLPGDGPVMPDTPDDSRPKISGRPLGYTEKF
jgi:hypothetical protein